MNCQKQYEHWVLKWSLVNVLCVCLYKFIIFMILDPCPQKHTIVEAFLRVTENVNGK